MKKLLLSTALCLFCAIQMSAQSFNEELLEGIWENNDNSVEYSEYIGTIKKIRMGLFVEKDENYVDVRSGRIDYKYGQKTIEMAVNDRRFDVDDTSKILDYFITGNNRLHILVGDAFTLHFTILQLDANTMKLQTKKGIMTFTKATTQVQGVKAQTNNAEKARYNAKGQRINRAEKGLNIIQSADNTTRKELVK
jgi:hypothetical protein